MSIDTYKCPDSQCMEIYTVKPGDTLYAISQAYGIPVAQLMQVNRILNPYNLKPGQKLCIPMKTPGGPGRPMPPAPEPMPCRGTSHTIAKGDTLYMIAKQYGVKLDDLMKSNPQIDPYHLKVGDVICIPPSSPGETPNSGNGGSELPSKPSLSECYGGKAYATQRGDTLTRIIERFGLTYGQLLAANPDIDFESSLEGLTLCIPKEAFEQECEEHYVVASGDTLDSISQRFLMVSDRLLMANPQLTVADFSTLGTEICIPR